MKIRDFKETFLFKHDFVLRNTSFTTNVCIVERNVVQMLFNEYMAINLPDLKMYYLQICYNFLSKKH